MSPLPIFAIPSVAALTSAELWRDAVVVAGGTVSGGRLTLVNNLIEGLKADSVWTLLDRLWLHAAENTQSALIDLVARATATAVSTPTFTTDRGYTTSGTAYINTGTIGGPNYTQNSAIFGVGKRTNNGAQQFCAMGSVNTDSTALCELYLHYTDGGAYCGVNGGNVFASTPPADDSGNFLVRRNAASGATSVAVFRNGSSISTEDVTSNGVPNQNFVVGGLFDTGGTFGGGGAMQFSWSMIGAGLNDTQVGQFNTRVQTYLTAVGA